MSGHTFFVVVLTDLVPFRGTDSGLLAHALSLTRSVDSSGSRIMVVAAQRLAHVITKA